MSPRVCIAVLLVVIGVTVGADRSVSAQVRPFEAADIYRQQAVGDVQLSPDGERVAYSVRKSDRPGRPYSEVWVMEIASGEVSKLGGEGGFEFFAFKPLIENQVGRRRQHANSLFHIVAKAPKPAAQLQQAP